MTLDPSEEAVELRILQSGAAGSASGGSRLAVMARGRGTTRPHLMENQIQCDECVTSVTACSDQNTLYYMTCYTVNYMDHYI